MGEIIEDIFAQYKIDTNKAIPYHTQVYQALDKIATTVLKPGDRLPGEPKLCDLFGVSRSVVRQALNELAQDGVIVRIMGKGTYVAEPKINETFISQLIGFHENMTKQGYSVVSKVLRQEVVKASTKIALNLQMNTGDPVIAIRRLRFVNDVPVVLVTTYLPERLCPDILHTYLPHQSLYAVLEQHCDLHIFSGKRLIEALLANEEQASLLNIKVGDPLLLLDSVSYLEDGTALEYYQAFHRCDRTRFEVNLFRTTG